MEGEYMDAIDSKRAARPVTKTVKEAVLSCISKKKSIISSPED